MHTIHVVPKLHLLSSRSNSNNHSVQNKFFNWKKKKTYRCKRASTISLQIKPPDNRIKHKPYSTNRRNVIDHVIKDCSVDATIIILNNVIMVNDINVVITLGILTSSICNNILLNIIVKNNQSINFKERRNKFFRCGLLTHLPGAIIYSNLLHVIFLYILCFALGMSYISNFRYTLLTYVENKCNLIPTHSVILRIMNNILGYIQSMCVLKIITCLVYLVNLS